MVENPWPRLSPSGNNLVLQIDQLTVSNHNFRSDENHKFHLEFVPEPFIGNVNATVVALNANPGYDPLEVKIHTIPTIRKIMLDNLCHNYPGFYYLSKEFDPSTGATWWRKKLRRLIEETSNNSVSRNLLVIESMAYHSKNFKFVNLPSQQYSCQLVKMSIARGAIVIMMRSERVWYDLVPELRNYRNLIIMNNPQSTYFSPGNLPRYNEVVKMISHSR
jgi:hypothetical protein